MVYEGTLSPSSSTAADDVTSTKKQSTVSPSSSSKRRSSERPTSARPKKRVKSGCLTCRKRRVKCGEEKPSCKNCIKRGKPCVYGCNKIKWPDMSNPDTHHLADQVEVDLMAMMNQGCFHNNQSMTPPASNDGSWIEGANERHWSQGFPPWQPPPMPFPHHERNWTQGSMPMPMHHASAPVSPYLMREPHQVPWGEPSSHVGLPIDPSLEMPRYTAIETPISAVTSTSAPFAVSAPSYFPLQTDLASPFHQPRQQGLGAFDYKHESHPFHMQFFGSMLQSASTGDASPQTTQASSVISFEDPRAWDAEVQARYNDAC